MGIGIIEIVFSAIGIGIFFYLAFELVWETLPDNWLNRIDFKPFNCYVCFVAWCSLFFGLATGLGWQSITLAGIASLTAFNFNKLF